METKKKNWFARHKILTVILVLFVLGSVGASSNKSGTKPSTVQNVQSVQQTQPTESPKPVVVEATELVSAFDSNKLAAQDKYTGKTVQTTAYIQNISQDIVGAYFLSLKPSNDQYYFGTTLKCSFKDKSELTSLAKGQSVTVQGKMEDMALGIVSMKDCVLVK